jgi:hypothetical protein
MAVSQLPSSKGNFFKSIRVKVELSTISNSDKYILKKIYFFNLILDVPS